MKLLIDVEKDYYEIIKYNVEHGQEYKPFEIIANGIPFEERPQGDTISREALKKAINDNGCRHSFYFDVFDVIDDAPAVEEKSTDEWVPISERLPDKNMPCLVSVGKFNFTQIAMYSDLMETIDHKIFYQGDYGKNNFQNITEYVKAWQPLPEPYKEGGAENDV